MNKSQLLTKYRNTYPDLKNINDDKLFNALVKKFPEYKTEITDYSTKTSENIFDSLPNIIKLGYNRSIQGMAQEMATGKKRFDLSGYEPGVVADLGAGLASFLAPADLTITALGGGIGGAAAKNVATKYVFKNLVRNGVKGTVAKDVWLYSPEGVAIGSNNDKLVKLLSHGSARLVVSGEHVGINTTAPANSGLFGGTQTSFNVMGSTAPEVRIKSNTGDCDTSLIASNSSSNFFIINGANGVALSHDGTSFGSASDERKKDIIENITDAETKINKLRAVIGKYKVTKTYDADVLYTQEEKDDGQIPDGKDVGDVKIAKGTKKDGDKDDVRRSFLIAQDFLNNFPDVVSEVPEMDNDGNETSDTYYQLEYQGVIPLLVAGIKELSAKCADYEKRIKALEGG